MFLQNSRVHSNNFETFLNKAMGVNVKKKISISQYNQQLISYYVLNGLRHNTLLNFVTLSLEKMQIMRRQKQESVRNPSETDSITSQISSKTSSGIRTAQKDAIKDITSDSQVKSCFPKGGHRLL